VREGSDLVADNIEQVDGYVGKEWSGWW
jgi:hypothetical protein